MTDPTVQTSPDVTQERVALTPEAAEMLRGLWAKHGPLMFHQSGGCCDGSSPMCFADGDFITSEADVRLGDLVLDDPGSDGVRQVPFWMSVEQYEVWKHTHLTVDLVQGRGAGFSLEAPTGHRFLIRSRLMNSKEAVVGDIRRQAPDGACVLPTQQPAGPPSGS